MRVPARKELRVILGLARLLVPLAPNFRIAALNTMAIMRVWTADRGWSSLSRPASIHVSYRGTTFRFAAANVSEIQVVNEMFVENQYELPDEINPCLIVDLGSNCGASIAFFRATYPNARLIGCEPDPDTFDRLRV